MTFREAVLKGCETTEQAFEASPFSHLACVLQAAELGIGIDRETLFLLNYDKLAATFPILSINVSCPECGLSSLPCLMHVAFHLNDDHRWPRERIAAWADTYEQPVDFERAERESREVAILSASNGFRTMRPDVETIAALSEQLEDGGSGDLASAILNRCTVEGM